MGVCCSTAKGQKEENIENGNIAYIGKQTSNTTETKETNKKLETIEEEKANPENKDPTPPPPPKEKEIADESLLKTVLGFIETVVSLVQTVLGRTQMTKILLSNFKELQSAFKNLKSKGIPAYKESLTTLLNEISELMKYCESVKKSKKAMSAKNKGKSSKSLNPKTQLRDIAKFNEQFHKSLSEIQAPLNELKNKEREEKKRQQEAAAEAEKLLEKVENLRKDLEEKEVEVLGLAQNDLTNEEAFIFWMEAFPNRYMVPVEEFSLKFSEWLAKEAAIKLSENSLAAVVRLINTGEKAENDEKLISAKELNTFLEHMPYDIDWDHVEDFEEEIADELKQRIQEVNEKRAAGEAMLKKKVEEIQFDETSEEKDLLVKAEYTRFLVKGAFSFRDDVKTEFQIRNVFIHSVTGKVICFGKDQKGEFKITGGIEPMGSLYFQKTYSNGDSVNIEGVLSENEFDGTLAFNGSSDEGDVMICLDVDHWFGYYMQESTPTDMRVNFKIIGENMTGISLDEVGAAVWFGKITENELHLRKQYISQHEVKYDGVINRNGVVTEIKGKWDIEGYTGKFLLSHNDEEVD